MRRRQGPRAGTKRYSHQCRTRQQRGCGHRRIAARRQVQRKRGGSGIGYCDGRKRLKATSTMQPPLTIGGLVLALSNNVEQVVWQRPVF